MVQLRKVNLKLLICCEYLGINNLLSINLTAIYKNFEFNHT